MVSTSRLGGSSDGESRIRAVYWPWGSTTSVFLANVAQLFGGSMEYNESNICINNGYVWVCQMLMLGVLDKLMRKANWKIVKSW